MSDPADLVASDHIPAGTPEDPITFGAVRFFTDGDQLVVGRRQGRQWLHTAMPRADTRFALRIEGQDADERRWAVELRDMEGLHPPVHLFFYREREPYGLPSGIRAWAERLLLPVDLVE